MVAVPFCPASLDPLRAVFGDRLQENVSMKRYTAARMGGPASYLLEVNSAEELAQAARQLWQDGTPFVILGGGSNVLVSDAGVTGVVLVNRARQVCFDEQADPPTVWAESGANFGSLARQAVRRGLSGLEWASGIPGTVGGAVVGNAGAHGGDMQGCLIVAEILQPNQQEPVVEKWPVERLQYAYRSSLLKGQPEAGLVLAALLRLARSTAEAAQSKMDAFAEQRRRSQPPGASLGSIFKNPAGDYAGRLIEAAGLKGARRGGAVISPVHANFIINQDQASSADYLELINLARSTVAEKFGVKLELEIELLGEW